jgi:hypothetical protein
MIKQLEQIANTEVRDSRFPGTVSIQERKIMENGSFAASVFHQTNKIEEQYNPEYEEKKPGKTGTVIKSITRHEIKHIKDERHPRGACPRTIDTHIELYNVATDVLFPKGYTGNDVQYIVNAFEDVVVNVNEAHDFNNEGMVRFYEDQFEATQNKAKLAKSKAKLANTKEKSKGSSTFYEAFVKLQQAINQNKNKKMLNRFYMHDKEVKRTLDNFFQNSGLNQYKTNITVKGKEVTIRDREAILDYINNEKNWKGLVKIFCEEFSRLMTPGYAMPIPGLSGSGTKGRENEEKNKEDNKKDSNAESEKENKNEKKKDSDSKKSKKDGAIAWGQLEGGNAFDKQMKDPETRKDLAWKEFREGKSPPKWQDYFEALDGVYEKLARRLNFKVEDFTNSTKMPIMYYGKKEFDPSRDRSRKLTFGFDDAGKISLKKRKWHEDIPLEYKVSNKGFPEIRFVLLDTSGSMESSPDMNDEVGDKKFIPWGTNSKYHYALLGWYGFVEYLKRNHLLKKTNVSLANFSDSTILANGLDEAKKIALKPQFQNTKIDENVIKKMFDNRDMLMFTISDGHIDNWYKIGKKFIENAKKHKYFHLQIGDPNNFSEALENNGFPVYYIKGDNDLWKKVIEISDHMYRKPNEKL